MFMSKKSSPFLSTQNQTIKVIKEVNKNIKPCLLELKKKIVDKEARKKLNDVCLQELEKVHEQKSIVENLKEENEPKKLSKFDSKIVQELTKLNNLEAHLKKIAEQLVPAVVEEDTGRSEEDGDITTTRSPSSKLERTISNKDSLADPTTDGQTQLKNDAGESSNIRKSKKSGAKTKLKLHKDGELEQPSHSQPEVNKQVLPSNFKKQNEKEDTKSKKLEVVKDDEEDQENYDSEEDDDDDVDENNDAGNKPVKSPESNKVTIIADDESKLNVIEKLEKNDETDEEDDEDGDSIDHDINSQVITDDGDNDDDRNQFKTNSAEKYIALETFEGQEEGDLVFKKGEVLKVTVRRSDGWMVAVNDKGEEGLVPANFLQVLYEDGRDIKLKSNKIDELADDDDDEDVDNDEDDYDKDDDDVDDDDIHDEDNADSKINELNGDTGDEDDGGADDKQLNAEYKKMKKVKKTHSVKSLMYQLKHSLDSVAEDQRNELMNQLTNVPSGYRLSTLANFIKEVPYSLKYVMHPKLSKSGLMYKDLLISPTTKEIQPVKCKLHTIIKLLSIRNVPLPKEQTKLKCLDRYVRICLFDGHKFISNIVIVKVQKVDDDAGLWRFSKQKNGPCIELSEVFIRSNSSSLDIGLLCEVTVVLETELGLLELCCGWSFMKLFDDNGVFIANKTYRLPLNGGTPFEKGIPLDKHTELPTSASRFSLTSSRPREPAAISLKFSQPTKMQTRFMEGLPEPMIGQTTYLLYLYYLRQVLLDVLVKYRTHLHSTEPVHSPLLSSFLEAVEQHELMDVMRSAWMAKLKQMSRSDKKSTDVMKRIFAVVFMENIYPLLHISPLNIIDIYDVTQMKARQEQIHSALTTATPSTTTITTSNVHPHLTGIDMFNPGTFFEPFDTNELLFNPIDQRFTDNYF